METDSRVERRSSVRRGVSSASFDRRRLSVRVVDSGRLCVRGVVAGGVVAELGQRAVEHDVDRTGRCGIIRGTASATAAAVSPSDSTIRATADT